MTKEESCVTETVTVANVFEVVRHTMDKVGLEYMAPVEPSRLDEIISQQIVAATQGL